MAEPLFYVDLSEDARDYRHTALEPGLPLLDRQGVNYMILRRWLGDYVAEPDWMNENVVAFYMQDEERGRLEDVDCQPATKGELQKLFAGDLDAIRAKIKKIKAESSTEQMVLRILKKNIAEQANDLDASDFDSYFFKCRTGKEDWRLIWCVGYQRADLEPLRARLWRTPDGDFLGVRPPIGGRAKKRKRTGPLDVITSPWFAMALMLLIALFLWGTWPTLDVTPALWSGPLGSRIEYKVKDRRWYFFEDDVTLAALAQSNNPSVIEFEHGGVANAKSIGRAAVSFIVGSKVVSAIVDVKPPEPPDSLTIEPAKDVQVAVSSTAKLKAIGHYAGGNPVDLTTQVTWEEAGGDTRRLIMKDSDKGLIEGASMGPTKVVAKFPVPRKDDTIAEATIDVAVVQADFKSLVVELEPPEFPAGGTSRVNVRGIDATGKQHSLIGSSLVSLSVNPLNLAGVDGEYLVGREEGDGKVNVSYKTANGDLTESVAFTIAGRALKDDIFFVSPSEVNPAVRLELVPLNVTTGSDAPIEAVSANPEVVEVWRTEGENAGYEVWLAVRGVGETEVTVSQNTAKGPKSQKVKVVVTPGRIESLEFVPPVYTMRVGEPETANLTGTTEDGRIIKVVPDALMWEQQPRVENVTLDKKTLLMRPLLATESPQLLNVRLDRPGALPSLGASATVEVVGGLPTELVGLDAEAWGVHPPVPARGKYIDIGLGEKAAYFDSERGGLVIGNVDPFSPLAPYAGQVLTEVNGTSLAGLTGDELAAYFRDNRIVSGDVLRYQGADGVIGTTLLGVDLDAVPDFKQIDVDLKNVTDQNFDADLRLYLRQPGEYRLVDEAGTTLIDWAPFSPDATPLMTVTAIPRAAGDEYDFYVERRIADKVRRFQVQFSFASVQARGVVRETVVAPTVVAPTVVTDPAVVVEPEGKRVRERVRIRIPKGTDPAEVQRILEREGVGDGAMAPGGTGAPGPDSSAPGSPGPGSPAPGSPAPGSPAPGSPAPAPGKPAPGKPAPAPGAPAPAPGSPAPPQGSDSKAPPAPGKPAPGKPAAGSPVPVGSDSRAPSAVPATPYGSGNRDPRTGDVVGSATRGNVGAPVGSAARATGSSATAKTGNRPPPKNVSSDEEEEGTGNKLLDALKKYNRRDD